MALSIDDQIERLKHTIAEMEAQRQTLGVELIDHALLPLKQKLEELIQAQQAQSEQSPGKAQQQRKLVTLLFMDVVGSTSIAQHMDPEDVSEVFDTTLKQLAQPVALHGGQVTRFMGDGFLAVFGAPTAREEYAEQAVRSGLTILELAGHLSQELLQRWAIRDFQVRVGINTGMVLLGGETEANNTLMGASVNLASRLESAAPRGGLLISHDTYRHIRGVFDVEPWEPILAKGFDEPVKAYRVLRARPRAFRMYTRGVEGVETLMVGRETELKYLQKALLNAIEDSEGQMITLTGEAGVGKSRLLYEFQNWIELLPPPPVRFFEGRANSETLHLPGGLLRDLFNTRFQIQEDDRVEVVRQKICQGFQEVFGFSPDGEGRAHLLGQWLGYDFSNSPHLKGVQNDPEQMRNRGRIYLSDYFKGVCKQSPAVIFLEDIHWADDSSLDALIWLGERLHQQRIILICASRPTIYERRPFWGEGLAYHHSLRLEPLSKRESRQLVMEILKLTEQVPPDLREIVVEGGEGNPFYIEEIIKMLVEDGVILKGEQNWQVHQERLREVKVPPTLAGVLQARLDSLSEQERTVLQQASIVGRLFWDQVVAYILAAEHRQEDILPEALAALRSRELIYRREESTIAEAREYIFKHDILREVTYESVLKRLRKIYHGLVADWLMGQGESRVVQYSGLIGEHLVQAERKGQAGGYFLQAGETALAAYANREAEIHFRKAMQLLTETTQQAACLAGLGEALGNQGLRQEAVQILHQAIESYLQIGEHDRAAHLYTRLGQILWYIDNEKAWQACQEGLNRLEGRTEGPGLALLLAEAGRTSYFGGKPSAQVLSLCQRAIDLADRIGEQEAKAEASITVALCFVRTDFERSCQILEDMIQLSEANGLWNQAARAYLNLGVFLSHYLKNLRSSYDYQQRAIEISAQVGNIESVLFGLENLISLAAELGQLKTIEETITNLLERCSISLALRRKFLDKQQALLLYFRGEWAQALAPMHQLLGIFRKSGNSQLKATTNVFLALDYLELHRFSSEVELAEAEEAILENMEDENWYTLESRYCMVVLAARQKHLARARELVDQLFKTNIPSQIRVVQIVRLMAEAELLQAEQRWDEAIAAYQELIAIYETEGYYWRQARFLLEMGNCYAHRNHPGDSDRARAAYQQSLEMFTEMGATGFMQVLEERLGRHE